MFSGVLVHPAVSVLLCLRPDANFLVPSRLFGELF